MAGLNTALNNRSRLILDVRGIDHLESIEDFGLPGTFRKNRLYWKVRKLLNYVTVHYEDLPVLERKEVLNHLSGNHFLEGFFQSPEFLESLMDLGLEIGIDTIRTKNLFPKEVELLSQEGSALIHIRGGDFLEHRFSIGVLGQEYYRNVVSLLEERGATNIYVITDDIKFAQEVLPERTYTKINFIPRYENIPNYDYLSLFAFPKHLIISNSTFSWWGAQIAKADCNVIAPEIWNRVEARRSTLALANWETQPSIWF